MVYKVSDGVSEEPQEFTITVAPSTTKRPSFHVEDTIGGKEFSMAPTTDVTITLVEGFTIAPSLRLPRAKRRRCWKRDVHSEHCWRHG